MFEHVHISRGVSKLGASIPSVSLPPVLTCREDAPCASKCYARKGRYSFGSVKNLLRQNLYLWIGEPVQFERDVTIAAFHSRFFRWHAAGDIPDKYYLRMMVRVAESLPNTQFLCFTKRYEMVNEHIDAFGTFPKNLIVVFSAWGDYPVPNPHNLPMAYVRFKKKDCNIPVDALKCPNFCGECVFSGCSCWDLKPGQSVCFDEH